MESNKINNFSFGAKVKFTTNDKLKDLPHMPKLRTVEKMFTKETKGIKGNLGIGLYTQGRICPSLYTSVSYKNGKYEDYFSNLEDDIFFNKDVTPKKMVNKLKNILQFFEERMAYKDTISKKEKEIKRIKLQMNKIAENKGFSI